MPTSELRVGEAIRSDLQYSTLRGDKSGSLVIVGAGGRYQEAASRGRVFIATTQAATTFSAALTTTFTGLCLLNPNASQVNFAILQVGVGDTTAAGAVTTLGLMGGWSLTDQPQTTNTAAIRKTLIDSGFTNQGYGKTITACTLNATPVVLQTYGTWATTTTNGSSTIFADVNGAVVVTPGGYVCIFSQTAVAGLGSITYMEIPR